MLHHLLEFTRQGLRMKQSGVFPEFVFRKTRYKRESQAVPFAAWAKMSDAPIFGQIPDWWLLPE
tara:strand:+ start:31942 stop:32133 length:192 start_codon:yes stop_codon:yes gene_type:complete